MVAANPPVSLATARGHLDLHKAGQRSTKSRRQRCRGPSPAPRDVSIDPPNLDADHDNEDSLADLGDDAFVQVVELPHAVHSDLTGRFPIPSSRGNNYVLVSIYKGYIYGIALPSRKGPAYVKAYETLYTHFRSLGHHPAVQRLDNETSGALEKFFQTQNIKVEYVPAHNHRANRAERAIRTYKNHVIATLGTVHPSFPLHLWDELLSQINITINLLRPFALQPNISAFEGIHGHPFDFAAHPMAPCGTRVLIHDSPAERTSWAPHGTPGFYLGPALGGHYREFTVYSVATQTVRQTDTVAWLPEPFKLPGSSTVELVYAAMTDLATALTALAHSSALPVLQRPRFTTLTTSITSAVKEAAAMFLPPPLATTAEQRVVLPIGKSAAPTAPSAPPPGLLLPAVTTATTDGEQRVGTTLAPSAHPLPDVSAVRDLPSRTDMRTTPISLPTSVAVHVTRPAPHLAARRAGRLRLRPARYRHDQHLSHLAHALRTGTEPFLRRAVAYATLNLAPDGTPLTYRKAKAGPNAANWFVAEGEEICRLIDSLTMHAILTQDQPVDRRGDTTYYNPQTKEKLKADGSITYRIRGTAGGNAINYPGEVSARTADMEVVKALFQSAASDRAKNQGGLMLTADNKDFYLGTPLERPEYVRIPLRYIPAHILDKYHLRPFISNGTVLFEINKCMYGLPQAGYLSQRRLIAHLAEHGYVQDANVPCLFTHSLRGTVFTLVVDDFAVKYKTQADADHFLATLRLQYEITVNPTASKYLGFTIRFDDAAQTVSLSMPEYVPKMLARFCPGVALRGAASPAVYTPPQYGTRVQHAPVDDSPPLSPSDTHRLQEIVGCLLFYARAVDCTMLTAVNHVSSEQAKPTQQVLAAATRILQYAAAYPNHELVYHACDMVLTIQSDASYLSRTGGRSVAGGLLYCSNHNDTTSINGALLAVSCIIPTVCSF
jgi:hypothetical protein